MKSNNLTPDFQNALDAVTGKRARFVIDTILEKGFCSTEDLKKAGYEHAPRAARDVREAGIPLVTRPIKDSEGKRIAAYYFGDWEKEKHNRFSKTGGRTQLTNKLKRELIKEYGEKCHLYGEAYPARLLQPDHRIPYEIGGDPKNLLDTTKFMLLSPSANRDKSWACEHCPNWTKKDVGFCEKCYYAYPENYTHIAGKEERKIELLFNNEDLNLFEAIQKQANNSNMNMSELTKRILKKYFRELIQG